jgi:hypothetical protein
MLNKPHNNGDERLMTKFEKNDRVEITAYPDSAYNGFFGKVVSPLDQYGYVELALESVPVGYSEEWQIGGFYVHPKEISLAKQETKVTEFKAGDVVRLTRNGRNWYGAEYGYAKGAEFVLEAIYDELFHFNGPETDFIPWRVTDGGWVRSDDIELVSRKEDHPTVEITSEMIDWEDALFGEHETENIAAVYNITRVAEELVSLKIKKTFAWTSEDLIELGSHLFALAEYLETGTVFLSDEGECLECENEHLRDSNERLVSANEAKRQRLAKIRELTEA